MKKIFALLLIISFPAIACAGSYYSDYNKGEYKKIKKRSYGPANEDVSGVVSEPADDFEPFIFDEPALSVEFDIDDDPINDIEEFGAPLVVKDETEIVFDENVDLSGIEDVPCGDSLACGVKGDSSVGVQEDIEVMVEVPLHSIEEIKEDTPKAPPVKVNIVEPKVVEQPVSKKAEVKEDGVKSEPAPISIDIVKPKNEVDVPIKNPVIPKETPTEKPLGKKRMIGFMSIGKVENVEPANDVDIEVEAAPARVDIIEPKDEVNKIVPTGRPIGFMSIGEVEDKKVEAGSLKIRKHGSSDIITIDHESAALIVDAKLERPDGENGVIIFKSEVLTKHHFKPGQTLKSEVANGMVNGLNHKIVSVMRMQMGSDEGGTVVLNVQPVQ